MMWRYPLGSDETYLIVSPRWADFGPFWQSVILASVCLVPVGLILLLYRYELRLVRRWQATGLLGLRLALIAVIWCAVALQPSLARFETETPRSRVTVAVDLSSSMNVVDTQRTKEELQTLARLAGGESPGAGFEKWTRKEIGRRLLDSAGLNLLTRLARRHELELIGFHETRWPARAQTTDSLYAEPSLERQGIEPVFGTDLGQGIRPGASESQAVHLGVLLLTDGRHTSGVSPVGFAKDSGMGQVPIYPVLLGSARPPSDLQVVDLQAPGKAFKGASLPITARARALRLPPQDLAFELLIDGKPTMPPQRKVIKHDGEDRDFTVDFSLPAEDVGTHALEFRATPAKGGEITLENNRRERIVRVAEEKARVLLIDGEVRWEHHYLANALERDPMVRVERVVFNQPRLGLIEPDRLEKLGHPRLLLPSISPEGKESLFDYDCIILGDVAPEQLPVVDRRRLERYVADRGGTLILSAGKRHLPLAYAALPDDPLAKLMPIREPRVFAPEKGFKFGLTDEGKRMPMLQLDPDGTPGAWPELPKHYWAIVGTRKPGATLLAIPQDETGATKSVTDEKTPGLLVQQNYGFGRIVFVGIDSTWRWRFKVGDAYHHRFWGQLVRGAAAENLLPAGNRWARFGTREPVYQQGQEVEIAARLSDDALKRKDTKSPRARILQKGADQKEKVVALVPLVPSSRLDKLLEGRVRDLPAGTFRVEIEFPELQGDLAADGAVNDGKLGPALFMVVGAENAEMRDLSTDPALLQTLAQQSGGRVFTPGDVEQVLELLARRLQPKESRQEQRPWRDEPAVWWLFGLLVGLLSVEWLWRKRLDLP